MDQTEMNYNLYYGGVLCKALYVVQVSQYLGYIR